LQQQQQQQQTRLMQLTSKETVSSDVDDHSDTDDGLGYTLPNLQVYLSDVEGDLCEESERRFG
jgi:hypothetical protein